MLIPLGILAASGAGAAPSYEHIQTYTVGATPQASITFDVSSYSSTYQHLQIRGAMRSANSAFWGGIFLTFNGDTASNYATHNLVGNGSGVSSDSEINATSTRIPFANVGSSAPANAFGASVTDILDAYETGKFKTIRTLGGRMIGGSEDRIGLTSGLWRSTNAISSVTLTSQNANFVQGTRFSIYGLKAS